MHRVLTKAEAEESNRKLDAWWHDNLSWNEKQRIRDLIEEARKPHSDLPMVYAEDFATSTITFSATPEGHIQEFKDGRWQWG